MDLVRPRLVVPTLGTPDIGRAATAGHGGVSRRRRGTPMRPPRNANRTRRVDVDEDNPHIAYLTSGSTGHPKAVLVSHRASWLRAAPGGGTFAATAARRGGVVCTLPALPLRRLALRDGGVAEHVPPSTSCPPPTPSTSSTRSSGGGRPRSTASPRCGSGCWTTCSRGRPVLLRHADTGTSPVAAELVERIKAPAAAHDDHDPLRLHRGRPDGRAARTGNSSATPERRACPRSPAALWTDEWVRSACGRRRR